MHLCVAKTVKRHEVPRIISASAAFRLDMMGVADRLTIGLREYLCEDGGSDIADDAGLPPYLREQ